MKLLISSSSIENCETQLNKYYYSSTYKIIGSEVFFKNPPVQNENLTFKTKGKKFQIYQN